MWGSLSPSKNAWLFSKDSINVNFICWCNACKLFICVCLFFLMNMLVMIKPLFGDPDVKYEYKLVFSKLVVGYPNIICIIIHLNPFIFRRLCDTLLYWVCSAMHILSIHLYFQFLINPLGFLILLQELMLCFLKRLVFNSFFSVWNIL